MSGASVLERLVAGRAEQVPGMTRAVAQGLLGEGAQGMLGEGGDQVISNLATGKPLGEGVGSAAAMGLLLEGPMGAAGGALEGYVAGTQPRSPPGVAPNAVPRQGPAPPSPPGPVPGPAPAAGPGPAPGPATDPAGTAAAVDALLVRNILGGDEVNTDIPTGIPPGTPSSEIGPAGVLGGDVPVQVPPDPDARWRRPAGDARCWVEMPRPSSTRRPRPRWRKCCLKSSRSCLAASRCRKQKPRQYLAAMCSRWSRRPLLLRARPLLLRRRRFQRLHRLPGPMSRQRRPPWSQRPVCRPPGSRKPSRAIASASRWTCCA